MISLGTGLPLEQHLPELCLILEKATRLIITAEPGAGKTTLVPLALLDQTWLQGKKIVTLEPRRVAVVGAAARMADLLGEALGGRVGYRVALDSKVSKATRIEVVTEGILTRQIQGEPELEGVGCIIIDEFHERTLQGDLALALSLDIQNSLRPDLRIILMSATLDSQALSAFMDNAAVFHAEGRVFPVETSYHPVPEGKDNFDWTAVQIQDAAQDLHGDMLVFLPGQGEIRRLAERLNLGPEWEVHSLFGAMDLRDQKKILAPSDPGRKRIILATNVAETSLTIPGIKAVIDLGLVRVNRYDPASGLDRLVTESLSQASADQRRGRAGRLSGGICRRLWSRSLRLDPFKPPEILRADLTPLVLESALWGTTKITGLSWFTLPPQGLWNQALSLLKALGALDSSGTITSTGRTMAGLGMHPRLARMVLTAQVNGLGSLALKCAALLTEPTGMSASLDFAQRLEGFGTWERGKEMVRRWQAQLKIHGGDAEEKQQVGLVLAWAFPDRVGVKMREEESRDGQAKAYFQTVGGRAVWITGPLSWEEFLVFPEVDGSGGTAKAWSAVVVSHKDLEMHFSSQWKQTVHFAWDGWTARSEAGLYWGALPLKREKYKHDDDEGQLRAAVMEKISAQGLEILPWNEASRKWLLRVRTAWAYWMKMGKVEIDIWSNDALMSTVEDWLIPFLSSQKGPVLDGTILTQALKGRLDFSQTQNLERDVPTHFTVPSGSIRPLVYEEGKPVILEVRIQEIFGLAESPRVAGVPLLLHLLSPSQKPLQITQDLASFWKSTYPEVRKEMRGRYPKHYWPENPLEAEPTARAKPKAKRI